LSALTKVFVVLHVVLSLLFVSAVVVFVNKQEDNIAARVKADDRTKVAEGRLRNAEADAQAARGERDRDVAEARNRAGAFEAQNAALASDIQRVTAEVAAAKLETEKQTVLATSAQAQATAAQQALKASEDALLVVRKEGDDMQKKYAEAMVSVSDLTNKLDVMTRQYRKGQEDITALTADNEKMRTSGPRQVSFEPGAGGAAVPGVQAAARNANLKGVVRSKRNIQGVEYATISLGTADSVQKGMQFRVVDRTNNLFLGFLTIDTVDYNEATGHLVGPKVDQVRAGNDVLTNYQ
jgi:hypothetical protein